MSVVDLSVSGEFGLTITLDRIQNVNSMDHGSLPQILELNIVMISEGVKEYGIDIFPPITKIGSVLGKPSFQDMVMEDFELAPKASLLWDLDAEVKDKDMIIGRDGLLLEIRYL
ncbi:hypothetical protein V6N11_079954 [Hibiscus sabdariffa]|uniref:Uncharacterized protein n=1 Tax=Hibiscus sabdariffa TaxID=183260 RepID=A0ABR2RWV4_9ROSI